MAKKNDVKEKKVFSSFEEWKEKFLPSVLKEEERRESSDDPKTLGANSANELLQEAMSKLQLG